uniref:Peptidase S1 domain-containing protein n=1 Tax=Rhabditophanes sp. KR3021 TaxID=114890 RepID=A0AC35UH86_9BILA
MGSRVVGGKVSSNHSWPWVGQLINYKDVAYCGCALIGDEYVVTAAHCFPTNFGGIDASFYKVMLGSNVNGNGTLFEVSSISIHPFYSANKRSSQYDIALIKLAKKVNRTKSLNAICLNRLPVLPYHVCVVAGWGRTRETGAASTELREAFIPIVPNEICNDFMHYRGRVHTPSSFCAGYSDGSFDACKGDSGGPVMCQINGFWELHGIVSWGEGCARRGYPGVYTHVYHMKGWLMLELGKQGKTIDEFYS